MKKVGKLMEELGFRPQGRDEVKKAFVKNLIKAASLGGEESLKKMQKKQENKQEQLDFFSDLVEKMSS